MKYRQRPPSVAAATAAVVTAEVTAERPTTSATSSARCEDFLEGVRLLRQKHFMGCEFCGSGAHCGVKATGCS